jgi:hypothetical protein
MTAEIAILNRNAVALAADSAVTLRLPGGQKIYNTVNKLFMLSKYRPVGVMVYGSADLMSVPWETIIKMYRSELGAKEFDHLEDYARDFIGFFERENLLFPSEVQAEYVEGYLVAVFSLLKKSIDDEVKSIIEKLGSIDEQQLKTLTEEKIEKFKEEALKQENLPSFKDEDIQSCAVTYAALIDKTIDNVFQKLAVENCRPQLREIASAAICKKVMRPEYSGVVIAGFGERDIFPRLLAYECECIFANRLRYVEKNRVRIGENKVQSTLVPFAQREMVNRFMEGIDPKYGRAVQGYVSALLKQGYPEKIAEALSGKIPDDLRDTVRKELTELGEKLSEEFKTGIKTFLNSLGSLPKDELAAMAESLVNLTAFKRRMTSVEADTVALPIDVAVISKGDGFIWIKRKHYFEQTLNPYFFANYYRKDEVK